MKTTRLLLFVLTGWFLGSVSLRAQAPNSVNNYLFVITVTSGTAPLATSGTYRFFTSTAGSNYTVLGNAGAGFSSGTYSYARTGTNSGLLTLADSLGGSPFTLGLGFNGNGTGTSFVTKGAATQQGSYTSTNNATTNLPVVFLPRFTNGQFHVFLGGTQGLIYAVDTSSNLVTWNSVTNLTNLTVAALSTNFSDTNIAGAARKFYRARITNAAFAPASILGETFNWTITAGTPPLPSNGICQFVTAASGNTYQLNAGPGATNGSGTYTYSRSTPTSGALSFTDSHSVTCNGGLVFTSPTAGHYYYTNTSAYQEGTFTMSTGPAVFLGNLKFVADTNRTGSVYFPATPGASLSLSVTNANGHIWTLTLPQDSLLSPQTITMTPFASVDTTGSLLPVTSGVSLGPDGTQFGNGVTLSLKVPSALGAHASLMMGAGDGSALNLVRTTNSGTVYSTTIFHFTTGAVTDPTDQQLQNLMNQQLAQAQSAYNNIKSSIQQMIDAALSGSAPTPPPPPDYELSCDPNANAESDLGIYIFSLLATPEGAISGLMSAAQQLKLQGADPGDENSLALQLVESVEYTEIDQLFENYSSDPKKFFSVAQCAMAVLAGDAARGGTGERADWQVELGDWFQDVLDYYFSKLSLEHDYTMIKVLPIVQQRIELITKNTDESQFWEDMNRAMTFKLSVDIVLDGNDGHEEAKGNVTLTPDQPPAGPATGTATIDYVSGTLGPATLAPGQSFAENAQANNFDACNSMMVSIGITQFAEATETYTYMGYDVPTPSPMGQAAAAVFAGYQSGGYYTFPLNLQNMSAQAANQMIVGQGTGGSVTVTFMLQHTPQ